MVDGEAVGNEELGGPRRHAIGRPLVVAVVAALAVGGAGLGFSLSNAGAAPPRSANCGGSTPHLTVQGTGSASGVPDQLTAVFALSTTQSSAAAALSQNNTEVSEALLALAAHGVARKDVQTTNVTLSPTYTYPKGVQTISGYQVQNTVTATLHDVPKAGAAIDALVSAAGNTTQIQSLAFSFSNADQVQGRARAAAVRQAVADAKAMAQAAGHHLGPICSLTDNTAPTLPEPFAFAQDGAATSAGAEGAPSVPVEQGTQTETDQVTVVYAVSE
jgi:uncharacterized protein YggE